MTKKLKRGQSMFELLVAVFVIALSLTAIVSLVSTSIGNTTFSRDRSVAAKSTQEAVEWLRAERDSNWGTFRGRGSVNGARYCLPTLGWDNGQGTCSPISGTNLRREVILIYNPGSDPDTVEARVATIWTDSSGTHESRITTYLTNWRTR